MVLTAPKSSSTSYCLRGGPTSNARGCLQNPLVFIEDNEDHLCLYNNESWMKCRHSSTKLAIYLYQTVPCIKHTKSTLVKKHKEEILEHS
jgi:hypothetical protein